MRAALRGRNPWKTTRQINLPRRGSGVSTRPRQSLDVTPLPNPANSGATSPPSPQSSPFHYTLLMGSEADQILASVRAAYAECHSYKDAGAVTTTFFGPSKRTRRLPFSTRFSRQHGFLFEFRDRRGEEEWDQFAVWIDAGQPRTFWSVRPERDDPPTLGRALAGATGISGGSAFRVPHLLMPELTNRVAEPAQMSPAAKIIEVPEAALQNCVVVEVPRRSISIEQFWIDRSTFLIRRVVEPRHSLGPPPREMFEQAKARRPELAAELAAEFDRRLADAARNPVEVEQVTTYDAVFNADIAPEELRFALPSES